MLPAILFGLVLLAIAIIFFVWKMQNSRKLRGDALRKVRSVWLLIEQIDDPVRKIIEADKVLDLALKLTGFEGTTGEKMKKAGPRFSDQNGVWRAHKLRNTVAHELHAKIKPAEAADAMKHFKQALRDLGM